MHGIFNEDPSDEPDDVYSLGSDHFLTVQEGSSSSFGDSGNEPDEEETWIQWYTR